MGVGSKRGPAEISLRRWRAYVEKVFAFSEGVRGVRDSRKLPVIPTGAIFKAMIGLFVLRLPSVHQLEAELRGLPHLCSFAGRQEPFSEDTVRYSYARMDPDSLWPFLVHINQTLKRNKALEDAQVAGRLVAALDGVEFFKSQSRCCEKCLTRRITVSTPQGEPRVVTEYYHRAVFVQIVGGALQPVLGIEEMRSGEDEVACALRLLQALHRRYRRFFDILLLDALYAQAPVLRLTDRLGWDVVIRLKREDLTLWQDAHGLFSARPADHVLSLPDRTASVWDQDDLPFTLDFPRPVRVLKSDEQVRKTKRTGKKRHVEVTSQHWVWMSTLQGTRITTPTLHTLGHLRWKVENNGFNDLTQNYGLKHSYIHTEKAVPALLLTLAIAFNLFRAFVYRSLKTVRLYPVSLQEIARQLYRSVVAPQNSS